MIMKQDCGNSRDSNNIDNENKSNNNNNLDVDITNYSVSIVKK